MLNRKHLVQDGFHKMFLVHISSNILLFLQDNVTSPFEKMFLVQHFGSFGSNQYDHDYICFSLTNIQTNHLMSDFVLCLSWTVLFIRQLNNKPENS